jgi:hypothetical protein
MMQNSSIDTRSVISDLLDLKRLPHSAQFLDATLDLIESSNGDFRSFIKALIQTPFWIAQDFLGNPFKKLCDELANEP